MNFRNLLLAAFASTIAASAHPGHDLMAHGAGHVATSAYHLFVLFAVAVLSFAGGQFVRHAAARRILRAAGATALVAAIAVWTLGI